MGSGQWMVEKRSGLENDSFLKEHETPSESGCLSIIVLGASGDLAKKKTFPALYHLYRQVIKGKSFCLLIKDTVSCESREVLLIFFYGMLGRGFCTQMKSTFSDMQGLGFQMMNLEIESVGEISCLASVLCACFILVFMCSIKCVRFLLRFTVIE
jgi:hypothetical protein